VGARCLVSMKQVGLNVASDPFMAASTTGVNAGLVVICADDPGIHSSQSEQDNRHYAKLAKVPMLEPSDSQEAYDLMAYAFEMSERFDTPVLVRTTTRISHSKSVVEAGRSRVEPTGKPAFHHDVEKYVMLPVNARTRHPLIEERLVKLAAFAETFPLNRVVPGDRSLGIVSSGVAYKYAQEVFPDASFLKLSMTYPLPRDLIGSFAAGVERLIVIEELDPFLQESIQAMGIEVAGKEYFPRVGELNLDLVEEGAYLAGLRKGPRPKHVAAAPVPGRPPTLCPGCPHAGAFFVLSSLDGRSSGQGGKKKGSAKKGWNSVITGDIGCYTLGAYPPLQALDTCACMGAGIGQALGMEKAGLGGRIVAVIGDSTFLHSGITGLVNAVYNQGRITVIILDNGSTAMTGHQEHPGTGITAQGGETTAVPLEGLVRGVGVKDVSVIDAFDVKALRAGIRHALDSSELSVVIVRGRCPMQVKGHQSEPRAVDQERCNDCGVCLQIGCLGIGKEGDSVRIDPSLCAGDLCDVCGQLCPRRAIGPVSVVTAGKPE
ncbi:MAG: thiamine pyrophosphate-dependent enzyme, partial [Dehalococcoidia bacterium]